MDEDGNKKLNLEEFTLGMRETGLEISDEEIQEIFNRFDTDNDGSVSVDEFIVAIRVGGTFLVGIDVNIFFFLEK